MPILVAPTVTPTEVPFQPNRTAASWQWTSPTGEVLPLDGGPLYMSPGAVAGHMAAPVTHRASQPPTISGAMYRGQRVGPRDVSVSFTVAADTAPEWHALVESLVRAFDTEGGDGILTSLRSDGTSRSILARCLQGLESPEGGDQGGLLYGRFTVQLRAYDPWWRGGAQSYVFVSNSGTDWLAPPGSDYVIHLSPGATLGAPVAVDNPGDAPAYPVWTVTGPCSSVTFTRVTDDAPSLTVTYALGDGETIIVDTDPRVPGTRKIVTGTGVNLWGVATSDFPHLWQLPPGESTVQVQVQGGNAATQVRLDWQARYRTA